MVEREHPTLRPDPRVIADDHACTPAVDVAPRVQRDVRSERHGAVHEHVRADVRAVAHRDVAPRLGEDVRVLGDEAFVPEAHRLQRRERRLHVALPGARPSRVLRDIVEPVHPSHAVPFLRLVVDRTLRRRLGNPTFSGGAAARVGGRGDSRRMPSRRASSRRMRTPDACLRDGRDECDARHGVHRHPGAGAPRGVLDDTPRGRALDVSLLPRRQTESGFETSSSIS